MGKQEKGLVHLYVGTGKGKTTAAVGLAVRALGQGVRVLFCQFLKSEKTGELEPLARLGAKLLRAEHGGKFTFQMTPGELSEARAHHMRCFEEISRIVAREQPGLVVLDEVVDAVNAGVLDCEALVELIRTRPAGTELVMTGRNPPEALRELADYYTDFVCVAHPYQRGVAAREGVEY